MHTLDLSSFDTAHVDEMGEMFDGVSAAIGYVKTTGDANKFNGVDGKPSGLIFTVK